MDCGCSARHQCRLTPGALCEPPVAGGRYVTSRKAAHEMLPAGPSQTHVDLTGARFHDKGWTHACRKARSHIETLTQRLNSTSTQQLS